MVQIAETVDEETRLKQLFIRHLALGAAAYVLLEALDEIVAFGEEWQEGDAEEMVEWLSREATGTLAGAIREFLDTPGYNPIFDEEGTLLTTGWDNVADEPLTTEKLFAAVLETEFRYE